MALDNIPKRIIQFCHNVGGAPKEIMVAASNTKKNLPEYDYLLANDEFVKNLIIDDWDHRLYDWYCRNSIPASRADMARLLLLYRYGGFYIDLSMEIVSSLDDYLACDLALLRRDDFERYKDAPEKAHFTNSIIGVPPKSEFIDLLISKMRLNLVTGRYQYDVINCTGPGLINALLPEYREHLKVGVISFKDAKNKLFNYVRVQGFSNKWTELQVKGILSQVERAEETAADFTGADKKLQLHFGWPKVGSTTIQDFYLERPLAEKDYIYPASGRPNNVRAHHQLVKHKFSGPVADNLVKESSQYKRIVISSEQGVMDSVHPGFFEGLGSFVESFERDFKVHLYLKNIFEFIESAYAQCLRTDLFGIVKPDYDRDICSFVEDINCGGKQHILSCGKVISEFEQRMGRENVDVKVVGFNVHANDVLQDFIATNGTGPSLDAAKKATSRSNVSLSVPEKYILLLANKRGLGRERKLKLLSQYKSELRNLAASLPRKADFSNIVTQEALSSIKAQLDLFMPASISDDCREYVFREPDLTTPYVEESELADNKLINRIAADIRRLSI